MEILYLHYQCHSYVAIISQNIHQIMNHVRHIASLQVNLGANRWIIWGRVGVFCLCIYFFRHQQKQIFFCVASCPVIGCMCMDSNPHSTYSAWSDTSIMVYELDMRILTSQQNSPKQLDSMEEDCQDISGGHGNKVKNILDQGHVNFTSHVL